MGGGRTHEEAVVQDSLKSLLPWEAWLSGDVGPVRVHNPSEFNILDGADWFNHLGGL